MRRVIVLVAMIATPAFGQQPSPNEQALGAKLMEEFQRGLTCSAGLIEARAELAKAQARIRELEPKPPAPEEKK